MDFDLTAEWDDTFKSLKLTQTQPDSWDLWRVFTLSLTRKAYPTMRVRTLHSSPVDLPKSWTMT